MVDTDACDPFDEIAIGGGFVDMSIMGDEDISADPVMAPYILDACAAICTDVRRVGKRIGERAFFICIRYAAADGRALRHLELYKPSVKRATRCTLDDKEHALGAILGGKPTVKLILQT